MDDRYKRKAFCGNCKIVQNRIKSILAYFFGNVILLLSKLILHVCEKFDQADVSLWEKASIYRDENLQFEPFDDNFGDSFSQIIEITYYLLRCVSLRVHKCNCTLHLTHICE